MQSSKRRIGSLVFMLTLLVGGMLAYHQRFALYDWTRLRGYTPPAPIAQLATDTTMKDGARRLFYVYRPELNSRDLFSQNCSSTGEETIVLGCYVSGTAIYLFDVEDTRLQGVEQVTAAHEMLHAAYDRLSGEEKSRVNTLTEQTLVSLTDQRIKDTVENYRRKDPSIVSNELHSIIGTEVRQLPPELETYYAKYFGNRSRIVAFSEQYEGVLLARRSRAETLELQLNALKTTIDGLEQHLITLRDGLQRDRGSVDTAAEVESYNTRVNNYNADVRQYNAMVSQYNELVKEYQANALEEASLFKALDSRPTL